MRKLLILILLCAPVWSQAQYDIESVEKDSTKKNKVSNNPYYWKEHVYVGGDLSLRFGTQTYLYIAPFMGYEIDWGLSVGVSSMYQLVRTTFNNGNSISSHAYGGGFFTRWRPPVLPMVIFQAESNIYNAEDLFSPTIGERTNVPSVMTGLGYAGGGEKMYYQFLLMYDLIDDDNMPLPQFIPNFPLYFRYGFVFYLG